VRWSIPFRLSLGFVDQFAVFRVHVPALARVMINANICVNPDWAGKHCDGSAEEEQGDRNALNMAPFDRH
jgi:hypothetical protein